MSWGKTCSTFTLWNWFYRQQQESYCQIHFYILKIRFTVARSNDVLLVLRWVLRSHCNVSAETGLQRLEELDQSDPGPGWRELFMMFGCLWILLQMWLCLVDMSWYFKMSTWEDPWRAGAGSCCQPCCIFETSLLCQCGALSSAYSTHTTMMSHLCFKQEIIITAKHFSSSRTRINFFRVKKKKNPGCLHGGGGAINWSESDFNFLVLVWGPDLGFGVELVQQLTL